MNAATHVCPKRGCDAVVSNRLYACARHWYALSPETRALISRTAGLSVLHPDRRAAFAASRDDWEDAL
jgi:hypothetical protein